MTEHRKVLKFEKSRCIECDNIGIEIIRITEEIDGVFFENDYEECCECGNRVKIKLPEKRTMGDSWRSGIPTKF